MSEVLVRAQRVSKTFGEQRALADVSFDIGRGEIHALVGENGSGKSTFIKILSGFYVPDRGSEVSVDGEPLDLGSTTDSHRRGMRFVHQNLGIVEELDAVDNMGLAAGFATGALWTVNRAEQERRARALLARIGVEVDLRVPAAKLRPVERSAIAIARALDGQGGDIRLLVLDEPTAALPPLEVEALFSVIRDIAASGVSVLYVSHRLDEILTIADRVSVLRDGRYQGTFPAAGLSRDDIVRHILGHDLADAAPAEEGPTATANADDERPGLSVQELRTTFLRGVSFEVQRGEILGFAGLDGSGRDELAGALGGAVPATGRLVDARGRTLTKLRAAALRRHGIALVLPNWHAASAVKQFDLRENVSLATLRRTARFGVVRPRAEFDEALRWLTAVDIRPVQPEKNYAELSGGNKQKVIVARWLATHPDVLVLDDPTSGVDIGARHQIYDLVRQQAARGLSVVICSSDLEDLVELCDRVACLVNGEIRDVLSGAGITESRLLSAITAGADRPLPVI
jgi:ribose transport system ATP-binding protein